MYYECYSIPYQQGELRFYQRAVNPNHKGIKQSDGISIYQDRPLGEIFGGRDAFLLVYRQP